MKLFETTHEYPHDWAAVTLAFWRKYPNPCTGHVKAVDILSRTVDPETGILRTERLICCVQSVPTLIKRIFGTNEETLAYEISEVDPKGRTLRARTVNLTFSNLIGVEESLSYSPSPSPSGGLSHTLFSQEARISASGPISRFGGYIEDFSVKRFRENAAVGRRGFEWVLERLHCESRDWCAFTEGVPTPDLRVPELSPSTP